MFRAVRFVTYGFAVTLLASQPLWAAEWLQLRSGTLLGQEPAVAEVPASTGTRSASVSAPVSEGCEKALWFVEQAAGKLHSDPASAEKLYAEALLYCPDSANIKLNMMVAVYGQGRADEAIAVFKALVRRDPDNTAAMRLLAYALVDSGIDAVRGKMLAETVLATDPTDLAAKKIVMLALLGDMSARPGREAFGGDVGGDGGPRSFDKKVGDDRPPSSGAVPVKTTALADIDIDIPVTGIENPDAIAVVIGNRDYGDKDIPAVEFAINDAESVKKYLINVLGYQEGNIIYLPNATKARFEATFGTKENYRDSRLYNYLKEGKSDIFIYYSGHGAPDLKTKDGYFVPVDADPQTISLTGYSLQQLYDNIAKIAGERKSPDTFIVIDACFSGASEAGLLVKNASPITISVENPLLTMENTVVLTSSSGAEISSWYPEKNHSMFTYFFLKALREGAEKPDGEVTAEDIFLSLSDSANGLPYYARRLHNRIQTPQLTGDKDRVFIEGDGFDGALEGIL